MDIATIRLAHYYAGVFFAPTIFFFAFTGVMQVFGLHESYRQTPGAQGDAIAWMSQIHKEAALIPPKAAPAKASHNDHAERSNPFKYFAALMGISLMGIALAGIWIAFKYPNRRRSFTVTLIAGVVIPMVLIRFGGAG